ncbi:MAG TPA: DUF5916 domain-containing protein [Gemmatimonadota bacterium]|nr:DUF5916 domain-containing protein [Gemmatimonadota bacterium]
MPRSVLPLVFALAGLMVVTRALAQPAGPQVPQTIEQKRASALRVTTSEETPRIDGRLDDPVWSGAQPLSDFIQRRPSQGRPSAMRTVARIAVDEHALYVAVEAFDPEPERIVGRLTRRDELGSSDWIFLLVDADLDRVSAFEFFVNPAGVKADGIGANGQDDDIRWDAVWDVATGKTSEGWTAEFRIPLSMLRFSPDQAVWGINVGRIVQRLDEQSWWSPIPNNDPNFVKYLGEVEGFRGLEAPRRLELLPYTLAQVGREPGDQADPFYDASDWKLSGGLDLKYGLTSNLTLDATLNPDFGQVEADPSEVNLSAFETFFEERRPFFVEGADIYRFGLGVGDGDIETLFYSRRIGRAPQGEADDRGGWVEFPDRTSIFGAAKLSGRTAGGWSIGVLDAVTDEESARVLSADGERLTDVVEPRANYSVVRVLRDMRAGATRVGAVVTGTHRQLDGSGLEDLLRSTAYAGGLDLTHRFAGDRWRVSGKLLASRIEGSPEAIVRAQRSSARFFQRPDSGQDVDSMATSMSGWSWVGEIAKESGGPWRAAAFSMVRSPGFEVNDLGFMRETDMIGYGAFAGYRLLQPNRFFRSGGMNVNYSSFDNFDGLLVSHETNVNGNAQLQNFWFVYGGLERDFDNWQTDALRGGPAIREPGEWSGWYGFESDDRRRFQLTLDGNWSAEDDTDGRELSWSLGTEWQASEGTSIRLAPFFETRRDAWQYVTTVEDGTATPRYVFADIRQRTFGLTTRVDYTLTPTLSIQLYAQPFVSAGDYSGFKRVADPTAETPEGRFREFTPEEIALDGDEYRVDEDLDGTADFSFDRPDFNFREFRSNLVARWEYRPGSTIFFVWSQGRDSTAGDPSFRLGDDLGDLFRADAHDVFLVKINGWLNL